MSAARTQPNRSNRPALSLPYARPAKKSSWSLSSFLSYLNPLRSQSEEEDVEGLSSDEEYDEGDRDQRMDISESAPSPGQTLSKRGLQLERTLPSNGHSFTQTNSTPRTQRAPIPASSSAPPSSLPSVPFTFTVSTSPAQNLEAVSQYLTSHVNKPISEGEVKSLVSLIQQSKPVEAEYFRFESRPSSSPPRSTSPSEPPPGGTTRTTRKLNKNPNGPYTWRGAGSSRPRSTNRYSSPAFRAARRPVSQPASKVTSGDVITTGDSKRRRVEDPSPPQQSTSGTTQSSITSSPTTSRTGTSDTPLKPAASGTPSARLRTPGLAKPTTPAHPSPLRQAWSESTSEKQAQTQTAKHVSQLVSSFISQDAKVLDIRNPYEAALPVKLSKRKRVPPVKKTAKPASKNNDKTEVKIKELPAHAIIEATLPEGSKRSRPPPNLEKSPHPEQPKLLNPPKVVVEEVDDEDGPSAAKKAKPLANGHGILAPNPSYKPPSTETQSATAAKEVKEKPVTTKPAPISVPSLNVSSKPLFGPKSSVPKEPSKLRYSMQVEPTSAPSSPGSAVDEPESAFKPLSLPAFNFKSTPLVSAPAPVLATQKAFSFSSIPSSEKSSIFSTPSTLPVKEKMVSFSSLPEKKESSPFSFNTSAPTTEKKDSPSLAYPYPEPTSKKNAASFPTFSSTSVSSSGSKYPKIEVKVMSVSSLPTFNFPTSIKPWGTTSGAMADAKAKTLSLLPVYDFSSKPEPITNGISAFSAPKSTTTAFNWSVAGAKPPTSTKSSDAEWTCDTCMLKNPGSAKEKCTVCEADRPGAAPAKATTGFDWSAVKTNAFSSTNASEWTCNTCMLKNPASVKDKCTVCDSPKPGAAPVKTTSGFNWSAAGIKPPSSDSEWTCNSCMLKNPASAKDKCTICDADRS